MTREKEKRGENNVQRKESDREEQCEVQLLRNVLVRNLFLRLPEERVPMPREQVPVWLPNTSD